MHIKNNYTIFQCIHTCTYIRVPANRSQDPAAFSVAPINPVHLSPPFSKNQTAGRENSAYVNM